MVGLVLVLLLTPVASAAPVQAGLEADAWARYPVPGKGVGGGWVLTSDVTAVPAEQTGVTAICVGFDGTLYAAAAEVSASPLDGYDLFKSTDDGYTWEPLWKVPAGDKPAGGPASDPASEIIALLLPRWEYPDILYLATQYNVYKSADGGENFTTVGGRPTYGTGTTGTSSRLITSLDVIYHDGSHLALVGSRDADAGAGDYGGVYFRDGSRPLSSWVDLRVGGGAAGTVYDVLDVTFSPGFPDDEQVAALVTDAATTRVTTRFGSADWNTTVGDAILSNLYVVPAATFVSTGGCLALPADYDSDVSGGKYIQYAGVDAGANSAVYMVAGMEPPAASIAIPLFVPAAARAVHSLIIAGETAMNSAIAGLKSGGVLYSDAEGAFWWDSYTPPSVTATASDTCIALGGLGDAGYVVYAGTSGVNSGFARSINGGATFARQSFICDDLQTIADLAVSPNYAEDGTVYMITTGNSGRSVLWRTADGGSTWDAVLTEGQLISAVTAVPKFNRVALSPRFATDITVFICQPGAAPAIWRSTDNGFRFAPLPARTGTAGSIDSWAIAGNREVLVGDSLGDFYRTTNGGLTWSLPVATGLAGFSAMELSPDYEDDSTILAGGKAGRVYLSTDGGERWRQPAAQATGLGAGTLVAFSPYYADDGTIYAADRATDTGILRFVIGEDMEWRRIDRTSPSRIEEVTAPGRVNIRGLQVTGDGNGLSVLYATDAAPVVGRAIGTTPAEGGAARSLNPAGALSPAAGAPVFEVVNTGLAAGVTLSGLWQAGGSHRLWAVDTAAAPEVLYTYEDTLTIIPQPVSPADGASSGRQSRCQVSWDAVKTATSYNIWYDTDLSFKLSPAQAYSGAASADIAPAGGLESGTTYYWRVRAGQRGNSVCVPGTVITFGAPALSRYSDTWSFTTALGGAQWSPFVPSVGVAPLPGAGGVSIRPAFQWNPADWATGYEFELSKDPRTTARGYFVEVVTSATGDNALVNCVWLCDRDLDYSTTYYWHVKAVSATSKSVWGTGVFTTEAAPPAPEPPPPPPPPTPEPTTPAYIWWIIGIGAALCIAVVVLIVRTRRAA